MSKDKLSANLRDLQKNVTLPNPYIPLMEPITVGEKEGFRDGTRMHQYVVNFAFNEGGLGDYINYSAALIWVHQNCPWIVGRLVVVRSFLPLFEHIFKVYGMDWELIPGEEAGELIRDRTPLIGPEINMNGTNVNPQLLNPIGAHLIDLGFAYYTNQCPAPKGITLPYLDFKDAKLPHKVRHMHGKYVVITTGAMTPSRFISGAHINPLLDYIIASGFTPVFLGKKQSGGQLKAVFADDIEYQKGLDLRDQTDLLTAAAIMAQSIAVVGIDNGLLHLAACTDANVLFGYSIAGRDQREPRRSWGRTFNLALTSDDLSCANCQSHMKIMLSHTFHKCFYNDNKCIDILFIDKVEDWKYSLLQCFKTYQEKDHGVQIRSPEAETNRNVEEWSDQPRTL